MKKALFLALAFSLAPTAAFAIPKPVTVKPL